MPLCVADKLLRHLFNFITVLVTFAYICKTCLPGNLYCVGGDVKHCSVNQSINQSPISVVIVCYIFTLIWKIPIQYIVVWL